MYRYIVLSNYYWSYFEYIILINAQIIIKVTKIVSNYSTLDIKLFQTLKSCDICSLKVNTIYLIMFVYVLAEYLVIQFLKLSEYKSYLFFLIQEFLGCKGPFKNWGKTNEL